MSAPDPDLLREAAVAMARRGFRVFPLEPGRKVPAFKGWQQKATNDVDKVRSMWTTATGLSLPYNPGIVTDGLLVVDVDVKKDNGELYVDLLGISRDTFTVTSPSGGRHLYFKVPVPVGNSAKRIAPGLDVRGTGGFVVGPGAWLSGEGPGDVAGYYAVANERPPEIADEWLQNEARKRRERAENDGQDYGHDDPRDIEEARRALAERPGAVEGEGGDQYTFATACLLRDFGLSKATALDMLSEWNDRCEPPWEFEDLKVKVENAWRYASNQPGVRAMSAMLDGIVVPDPPDLRAAGWFYPGDGWDPNMAWLVHDAIPQTGVGLLSGQSGSGKTFLALDLAQALSDGVPWMGHDIDEPGGTAVLVGEAPNSLRRRLEGMIRKRAEDGKPGRLAIGARPVMGLSEESAMISLEMDLLAKAKMFPTVFGVPLRLVVIDTFSAAGLVADENSNADVARVLKRLEQISTLLGVFILVVHHPRKDGRGERGAGALRDNADVVFNAEYADEEKKVRTLFLSKTKDAVEKRMGYYTLGMVDLGKDARGRTVSTCVIEMAEAPTLVEKAPPGYDEAVTALETVAGTAEMRPDGQRRVLVADVEGLLKGNRTLSEKMIGHLQRTKKLKGRDGDYLLLD